MTVVVRADQPSSYCASESDVLSHTEELGSSPLLQSDDRRRRRTRRRPGELLLRILLDAHPAAAAHPDDYDWTPLHIFCHYQIEPRVEALAVLLDRHALGAVDRYASLLTVTRRC